MSGKEYRLADLLGEGARRLGEAGIENARHEARLLAVWAMEVDAAALLTRTAMTEDAATRFTRALDRRAAREPMALIVGQAGFWTLDLAVSPDTLIPRADTETLIEALIAVRPDRQTPLRVLDLGTGTGALLLAALSEYPAAIGVGIDLVPGAAALAKANAALNGLSGRALFLCGHWDDALSGRFDVVLSNPPYIESDAIAHLMPEVSHHEPKRALDGGTDGLDAYRALARALPDLLSVQGIAILELGEGQAPAVGRLAEAAGLRDMGTRRDLGGIERAIVLARCA